MRNVVLGCVITALIVGAGSATAGSLIRSSDIADGTIRSRDIRDRTIRQTDVRKSTITRDRLSKQVRRRLKAAGATGPAGPTGPRGPAGPTGTAEYVGPHWGAIARGTIGSAVAALRSGPFVGSQGPPFGIGSLGIGVSDNALAGPDPAERASFGNEVDFIGRPLADISEIGFHVFQTAENASVSAGNLPNITFEINPNLASTPSGFSSLVFQPSPPAALSVWSSYRDGAAAGSEWRLTGAAGTETGCTIAMPCDWDGIQSALDDGAPGATIFTLAVTKGRDFSWAGAVDGLRVNNTIYDFEPFGVREVAAG